MPLSKSTLRKHALTLRETLPMDVISQQILARARELPEYQAARTILGYFAFRQEIDLLPLVTAFPEKRWYLPVVTPEASPLKASLRFHRYRNGDPLAKNRYGIPEPLPDAEALTEDTLGATEPLLILVPGLMFDRTGHRLGYGKGYYDRFLSVQRKSGGSPATLVGLTAEALLVDSLPNDPWDIPVSLVVTESQLLRIPQALWTPQPLDFPERPS